MSTYQQQINSKSKIPITTTATKKDNNKRSEDKESELVNRGWSVYK